MIIAFAGGMGTGKTTAAGLLQGMYREFGIHHFAEPVKKIARECFGWDDVKDEKGRKLLQIIGTEAGRAYNPDIWVDIMRGTINALTKCGFADILIDDLRFDNESKLVHDLGGCVILIKRNTGNKSKHQSEQGINDYDYTIDNNGSITELAIKLSEIIKTLNAK